MTLSRTKSISHLAKYEDLFERLLDCTLLLEPESHVVLEANAACEQVLGIPTDQLVGRSLENLVEQSARRDFGKSLRVSMRRYYPRQFETRWDLPSGRSIYMDVLACPLRLSDQKEVLQILARDITSRREAESKVQRLLSELQLANAKLEVLSSMDEMTGLHNFRHFKGELDKEHQRAFRYGTEYSIVFCDVDHFKKYNDRNGHPAGDQVLREFAKVLQKSCRSSDLVARYGGEEFVLICPGVDSKGASILAERIRCAVADTKFPYGEHQPLGRVTVSIGIASFPEQGKSTTEVLKAADDAVYVSKANGRNQVTASGQPIKKPESSAA